MVNELTEPPRRRAIGYCRISMDRSGEGLALARQDELLRTLARRREFDLVDVLSETVSAAGRPRKEFAETLEAIRSGRADTILVYDWYRLSRNRRDTLELVETGEKHGTLIVMVEGSDLDMATVAGRLTADLLAAIARSEIDAKGARQKAANAQLAALGRPTAGRRPYGYEVDRVTVRESEAKAIRDGYAMLISGASLGSIAAEWNGRGLLGEQRAYRADRKGQPVAWRRDSVRHVLRSARYAGIRAHRGVEVGPAVWPGIVSDEIYRAAADILSDPDRRKTPSAPTGLLTHVALCAVCGYYLHTGGSAGTSEHRAYRCSNGSAGHVARRCAPIDDYVWRVTVARLQRPDAVDLLSRKKGPDVAALRTEARAVALRLDQSAEMFADGSLTAAQLRAATGRLRERQEDLDRQIAEAGKVDVLGPVIASADVAATLETYDVSRRRAIIDRLWWITVAPAGRGTRTFNPDTVQIWQREA